MAEQIVSAVNNAALANDLVQKALTETAPVEHNDVTLPSETLVDLPGGLIFNGEVIKTAEVRELNGRDEEAIGRQGASARIWNTILTRAVVSIGNLPASEDLLDKMLVGDRDALLLGIFRATSVLGVMSSRLLV
jgi:hypothetical protein